MFIWLDKKKRILIMISMLIFLFACSTNEGKINLTNSTKQDDESDVFSLEDIEAAKGVVKEEFKMYEGCELTELWFDSRYLENKENKENFIILLSEFEVGENAFAAFNKNTTYKKWAWILEREDKNSEWKLIGEGFR